MESLWRTNDRSKTEETIAKLLAMANRTCVTIAVPSPAKLVKALRQSLLNSDYAEIRLDFLKPHQIPYCLTLVKRDLKRCICTLRPRSEGGKFQGTEKERISILKLIAEFQPHLLDVEYSALEKNEDLYRYLRKTKTNILVSWHDFKKTPSQQTLSTMLSKMSRFSKNIKIVTTARTIGDTIRILSLYKRTKRINLIAFAMGDYGRMSRILCTRLGSPYTYVSLGKPVAPGQFSLKEIKGIFDLE